MSISAVSHVARHAVAVCLNCIKGEGWWIGAENVGRPVDCGCTRSDGGTPRRYARRRWWQCLLCAASGDAEARSYRYPERRVAEDHARHVIWYGLAPLEVAA